MRLLIAITERNKGNAASEIVGRYKIDEQIILLGEGTAPSEILEYLSLHDKKKDIVLSLIDKRDELEILNELNVKKGLERGKTGMALTIKLSAINKMSYEKIVKDIEQMQKGEINMEETKIETNDKKDGEKEKEEEEKEKNEKEEGEKEEKKEGKEEKEVEVETNEGKIKKELIVYICNAGYVQEAMDDARKAGATGGTILHGRSSASGSKDSFFGIKIHPEKEILLIVCTKEQRNTLMEAINENHGCKSDAQGIMFSLEVSETIGVKLDNKISLN